MCTKHVQPMSHNTPLATKVIYTCLPGILKPLMTQVPVQPMTTFLTYIRYAMQSKFALTWYRTRNYRVTSQDTLTTERPGRSYQCLTRQPRICVSLALRKGSLMHLQKISAYINLRESAQVDISRYFIAFRLIFCSPWIISSQDLDRPYTSFYGFLVIL